MSDLIDRQRAIEVVELGITYAKLIDTETGELLEPFKASNDELKRAVQRIKNLPSAQPELPEECERCMMEHTDEMEKLEAELAMAQPKRGKWIRDGHHIRCDQCGMYMCDTDREGDRIPTEFCPSCGADMREVTI